MMDTQPLKVECSHISEGNVLAQHVQDEPMYVVSSEAVAERYWYSWNPYLDSVWAFDAWQQDYFSCRDVFYCSIFYYIALYNIYIYTFINIWYYTVLYNVILYYIELY